MEVQHWAAAAGSTHLLQGGAVVTHGHRRRCLAADKAGNGADCKDCLREEIDASQRDGKLAMQHDPDDRVVHLAVTRTELLL